MNPEQEAREQIDKMLAAAGWDVRDLKTANIHANRGVAIREFALMPGHGHADYLLYVDGKAAGVIEAKPVGTTLIGVEIQSDKYRTGLPETLPAWHRPLPFCYDSTGVATRLPTGFDPHPRPHDVFSSPAKSVPAPQFKGDLAPVVQSGRGQRLAGALHSRGAVRWR